MQSAPMQRAFRLTVIDVTVDKVVVDDKIVTRRAVGGSRDQPVIAANIADAVDVARRDLADRRIVSITTGPNDTITAYVEAQR